MNASEPCCSATLRLFAQTSLSSIRWTSFAGPVPPRTSPHWPRNSTARRVMAAGQVRPPDGDEQTLAEAMKGIQVRPAHVRDAAQILLIRRQIAAERIHSAIDRPWTIRGERDYLGSRSRRERVHVAVSEGRLVVGFQSLDLWAATISSMRHVGELGTFLAPEWRRRGLGSALFQATQQFGRRFGYAKFVAQVRASNRSLNPFTSRLDSASVVDSPGRSGLMEGKTMRSSWSTSCSVRLEPDPRRSFSMNIESPNSWVR